MINISKLYCGQPGQSDDLRYGRADSFGPIVVYNCTGRCNLKCLHCYSSSTSNLHNNELTANQAKQLLSDLTEVNCPVVLFSGGEPFLRKDIFELLKEAQQLGLQVVLSTNGTLIDRTIANKLADAGASYIGISLDGPEQFHDKFRQTLGCFKEAVAGIENCRKAGLRTGLRFTITKENFQQIPAVFDIAASLSVRRVCFYHLIRAGRAVDCQSPTPEQTRRTIDTIIERTDDLVQKDLVDEVLTVGNHADGPYLLLKMQKEKKKNFNRAKDLLLNAGGNKIGEKIVCIRWDGRVHPDQFWRNYSAGNVRDKSFKQIWENANDPVLKKLRNKSKFADKRCLTCKWFPLCKGNFRFLGTETEIENWLNEPPCYLTDDEIV
jgi:radical SAM protein with 4Fe4S-binding SPASM domain